MKVLATVRLAENGVEAIILTVNQLQDPSMLLIY